MATHAFGAGSALRVTLGIKSTARPATGERIRDRSPAMTEAVPAGALFRDPEAPLEARIDDLFSRMTLEEKVGCLSTNPSLPRLGIVASGHVEGLHGLAQGGPGKWGKDDPIPTTTFPQAIGLGETWDPDLVQAVAE